MAASDFSLAPRTNKPTNTDQSNTVINQLIQSTNPTYLQWPKQSTDQFDQANQPTKSHRSNQRPPFATPTNSGSLSGSKSYFFDHVESGGSPNNTKKKRGQNGQNKSINVILLLSILNVYVWICDHDLPVFVRITENALMRSTVVFPWILDLLFSPFGYDSIVKLLQTSSNCLMYILFCMKALLEIQQDSPKKKNALLEVFHSVQSLIWKTDVVLLIARWKNFKNISGQSCSPTCAGFVKIE